MSWSSGQSIEAPSHQDRPTDPLVLLITPGLPETEQPVRERLQFYFAYLSEYCAVLDERETFAAFDRNEQSRSIKFRALLLSVAALAATVKRVSCCEEGMLSESDLVYTYLQDDHRANALADSTGDTTLADVATSLHLFTAWEWLEDHERSWVHLQQALTRAQTLKVDESFDPPNGSPIFLTTRLTLYYTL